MTPRAAILTAGVAGLLAVACACAKERPSDPTTIVVVQIGDRIHTLAEFQRYLDDNLLAEEEGDLAGTEAAAVKSRLFDAFVEECLLALEADFREIQVADFEVDAYLGLADRGSESPTGANEAPFTRSDWETARRRLKIEKLLESVVRNLPPLTEPATPDPPPVEPGGERRLRLRSLMLETPELGAQVWGEIKRGRVTFDEAVVSHTTAPEQGMPIELAWSSLSEDHRKALEKLKPGEVSRPLEVGGGTYLFQVQAWLAEDRRDPEALAEATQRRMENERRAEALRLLISELRKNVVLTIYFGSLPFEYVQDDSVPPVPWNRVSEGVG